MNKSIAVIALAAIFVTPAFAKTITSPKTQPGQFILDSYDYKKGPDEVAFAGTAPFAVVTDIQVKRGSEEAFKKEIAGIVEVSRNRPGNMAWFVQQSQEDSTKFMFYTRWQDEASLSHHLTTSPLDSYILRTSKLMERPVKLIRYTPLDL